MSYDPAQIMPSQIGALSRSSSQHQPKEETPEASLAGNSEDGKLGEHGNN